MDPANHSCPPKVPPKKSTKPPSVPSLPVDPPKYDEVVGAGTAFNGASGCTQTSVVGTHKLDEMMNNVMQSIAELDKVTPSGMSSSMADTSHTKEVNDVMSTSLPSLPSESSKPSTPRPTPKPRPSTKFKPTASKRDVHQSKSNPSSVGSPKPAPRVLTQSHSDTSIKIPQPDSGAEDAGKQILEEEDEDDSAHYVNVTKAAPPPSLADLDVPRTLAPILPTNNCPVTSIAESNTPEEAIYDNIDKGNTKDRVAIDMSAFPLPPSDPNKDQHTLAPLSQESLNIFDPVQYMALWELQGAEPPITSSGSVPAVNSSPQDSTAGRRPAAPPIPPRAGEMCTTDPGAFTFPQGGINQSANPTPPLPAALVPPTTSASQSCQEFRNSYILSLPSDPFADVNAEDIFSCAASNGADPPSAEPVYSLACELTEQRFLPPRLLPSPPNAASGPKIYPAASTPHYTPIVKPVMMEPADSEPTYLQAEAVTSDSDNTIDEDTDEMPPLPPKPLPVAPSPKSSLTEKRGYLFKQGGKQNNKGWRRRYVTFDGRKLKYFSTEKNQISKRVIPIEVMKHVMNDVKDSDSNRFKFRLLTIGRTYLFAAESLDDHHLWTQTLMQTIIKRDTDGIGLGIVPGGEMHSPHLQGYLKLDDNKKYVAVKDGWLCYYNNDNDFRFATAIHELRLNTASVKDVGKNRLQLTTPYHQYSLTLDSEADAENWKVVIEDEIAAALSDDSVLNEVYQNQSNKYCADCSGPNPHWAVLHLSIVVCSFCAGIHRHFWPFKVKSLRMDVKIWTRPLIKMYVDIGNDVVNSVWSANLSPSDKLSPSSSSSRRHAFMVQKYLLKSFCKSSLNRLPGERSTIAVMSQQQLNQELIKSVREGLISDVIFLINSGADPCTTAGSKSAVELAESFNPTIAQYLKVNGAENESYTDIWKVMKQQYSKETIKDDSVVKSGHLYKLGKKEYPRHWLVLTSLSLKCYEDKSDDEPKVTISCLDIINLCRYDNERNEHGFELMCNHGGNSCIYGADDKASIDAWMVKLHEVMLMRTGHSDLGQEFMKAGHAHCKRGHLGEWKWCWVLVKKKQLYILNTDGSGNFEIDLRKINKLTLAMADLSKAKGPGEEVGPQLELVIPDTSNPPNSIMYMLQSDLKQETEKWFKVIDEMSKEVSPILEEQQLNKHNVPVLIEKCVTFICQYGMKVEGIYRHSGTHHKVTTLLNDLVKGARSVDIKIEEYTVNDVANVLKRYLRNLQDPIMSSALYGKWLSASMLAGNGSADQEVHRRKLQTYKELIEELPQVNFATLRMLIGHLIRVASYEADNKMSSINIATVFGPVLLSGCLTESPSQQGFKNTRFEIKLVDDLMASYKWLFSVNEEEWTKETELVKKMIEVTDFTPTLHTPEFLISIYIENNIIGEPINMKVSPTMTAAEVVSKVAATKQISRVDGYSLFHIVCDGELERSLAGTERVLDVIPSTTNWSQEHCKGSYMCVKEDHVRGFNEPTLGADVCRYTELQLSEKKGWKRMYFELTESQLIAYKDKSKNRHLEWRLSELTFYQGVEKKRKPPTMYGVTMLSSFDEMGKQQFLGRGLCFSSREEMFTWLSSIYTQTQELGPLPAESGLRNPFNEKTAVSKKKPSFLSKRLN